MQATVGFQLTVGLGKHVVFSENFVSYVRAIAPAETFYALTLLAVKLSMLYFYRRIFPSKTLAYFSYAVAAVIILATFAMVISIGVLCAPFTKPWEDIGMEGLCVYRGPSFTVFAALNVATNFLILVLPISYILQLQMTIVRKIHMVGIFMLGSVICVVTLLRLFVPIAAASTPFANDTTFLGAEGVLWSQIEINAAVFSACATCYRPVCLMGKSVLVKARSGIFSTYSGKSGSIDEGTLLTEISRKGLSRRAGSRVGNGKIRGVLGDASRDKREDAGTGIDGKEVVVEVNRKNDYDGEGIRVERGVSVEWESSTTQGRW
jgi:hypothetical protein